MKPKILFNLFLILFMFRGLNGQLGACNISTKDREPNVCDGSDYLVYISESPCGTGGLKCWCIIVDNRNRAYDRKVVEIELDHGFRVVWTRAQRIEFDQDDMELKFRITSGINRIFIQPYATSSQTPKIISFKFGDHEICQALVRRKKQILVPYQKDFYIEPVVKVVQQTQPAQDDYAYLNDCMQRRGYTANSVKFCPNTISNNFMIEKRVYGGRQWYWCIIFKNDRNTFSANNRLRITYSSQNKFLAWIPTDAHITQDGSDSNFHLGNRRTIIAVSVNNGALPNLKSVTIDQESICDYFGESIMPVINTPRPPLPTRTQQVYIPPIYNVPPERQPDVISRFPIEEQEPDPQLKPQPPAANRPNINKNCGIKPAKRVTLISHGHSTNPGDWPWHAAIYKLQSKINLHYMCGGTLIDRKTIITAAHCVLDENFVIIPDRIVVQLGRHDLSTITLATQELKVFDVIPHESYNPETIENDIAILVLANYAQLTTYVNFICLPEPNQNIQNLIGKAVGWGRDQNNQMQTELKEASMPVIDNIVCLSSNREFFGHYLTNTNFCAGYRNNTNVCRGDSGGGLVFQNGKHWFLGGIISLGVTPNSTELECDITQYVLFTDVTKFVNWIKKNS